ncbi:hypothetical protein AVEN_49700-1, partial [Araneus ventricosus]
MFNLRRLPLFLTNIEESDDKSDDSFPYFITIDPMEVTRKNCVP